ncbi:hypothetical protein M472_02865 [Sphingobacterium paucimobilis HER1398]|uniref:Uncharacterized protein n=1 Tax=Sphingobacterium paucimobilis HER1398 TaxID=1346330 RepID=U2HQZ1_9SPHI|nr:hypothetical protein M472_02865 [Sphingobacterium paucimobilis HER1398]
MEKQKAAQQVHRSESQEWQQYLQQDSTIRYWHFASDSIFYFHPDRGLWGQGGTLYYEEQSAHTHEQKTNISVSNSTVIQQHSSKTQQKTIRKKQLPWYIYLIMLLGLGSLGVYYLRRKRI